MKNFNNISDERLAAFIDGKLSEKAEQEVLNAVQSAEDLETLVLAISASSKPENEDFANMPDIASLGKIVEMRPFERLPMVGFLGGETTDSTGSGNEQEK